MYYSVLRRLVGLYACCFLAVIVKMTRMQRACVLWLAAFVGLRTPVPAVISGACMFAGECVAVRQPGTWRYVDATPYLGVPCWLLPLWILASQFCIDVADYMR